MLISDAITEPKQAHRSGAKYCSIQVKTLHGWEYFIPLVPFIFLFF
jgi:hypothetical protein